MKHFLTGQNIELYTCGNHVTCLEESPVVCTDRRRGCDSLAGACR